VSAALHDLDAARRREFRRLLLVSAVAHAGLLGLLAVEFEHSVTTLPGVVAVELVAAPAAVTAAPRPAPAPRPPPKPVPKKVVLPAQPTTPKPKAKPEPKPEPVAEPEPTPEPAAEEKDLSDVLAQLRADAGEETAEPPVQTAMAGGGGLGQPVSPEVAAWMKKAKIHVRQAWVLPPAFRTQALEAHVVVDLDASGNVRGTPEVVRRSGNPWFDEGVVRAIQKASPLPPPPEADEWSFVFVPGDSY
jgi:TonB family protein